MHTQSKDSKKENITDSNSDKVGEHNSKEKDNDEAVG